MDQVETRARMQKGPRPPNDLVREWYAKLEGFTDIEDENGELKAWHSVRFLQAGVLAQKARRSAYQLQIDNFANNPEFHEILKLIVKHGNSRFDARGIEYIWTMHRDAVTERRIAQEMKCSKSCIHFLLRRIRSWMTLM